VGRIGMTARSSQRLVPVVQAFQRVPRLWRRIVTRFYYGLVMNHVGPRSRLDAPLLIGHPEGISIGRETHIRRGARLETIVRPGRPAGQLIIGHGCFIEQNVQMIAKRRVCIGNNVSVAGQCAIVDVTHPFGLGPPGVNIGTLILDDEDEVRIDDGCFIGFGSVVLPGVHLGAGCVVGANSVVTRSFDARSVIAGIPARLIKTY
jgi:acetyltransferase-like isoleucine patch superfamily enzyme